MTDAAAAKPRRLRLFLALFGVALVVFAALLYLNRRMLAREALTGWLRSKGVASEAEVYAFGPSTFTARLRIGDRGRPDFTAARAEVRYRVRGFGFEVVSVTLREPVLRASLRGGRLSVGSLDPIVEEFRSRPPRPDAARPRILVDGGVLWLATDYGPLRLRADARVEDNKLMWLQAGAEPATLAGRGVTLRTGRAALAVTTRGARTSVRLDAPLSVAGPEGLTLDGGLLRITADGPYPDLQNRRGDGGVTLNASLAADALAAGDRRLEDVEAQAAFVGQATGWIPDLTLAGRAVADVRAASGEIGGTQGRRILAAAVSDDLRWTRRGGDRLAATLRLTGSLGQVQAADLTLERLAASFSGPLSADKAGARLTLSGDVVGRGRYAGLGAPAAEDSPETAAIKRAAAGFRIAAPGVGLSLAPTPAPGAGVSLRLPRPVRLLPDRGGEVVLSSTGADDWRLVSAGGGLPEADVAVTDLRLANGGASAGVSAKARLSFGPIQHGALDAAGRLRIGGGVVGFTASRCAALSAERLELGENDVERLAGRLCPADGPLFRMADGGWRLSGRAEDVRANAPFLQARVEQAAGPVAFGQAAGRLQARAAIEGARVEDAAPETRFNPLVMTGRAELARDVWTADLAFRTLAGQPVATAVLRHDAVRGQGGVDIDTGALVFAEGGLQPEQLSPLTAALGSPATGQARFTGRFSWTAEGATSGGELAIPRLDFESPAGAVTGLSGTIALASLAPLDAVPGQTLTVERLDAIAPLTNVTATFGLKDEVVTISGGEAEVGGGKVRIEALEVPFDRTAPTRGTLLFEGVQLHDVVEASPFGDKVELDARVSGRVPFEANGNQVRITGGDLRAIQPGRLSIDRSTFTGGLGSAVTESAGVAAPGAGAPADESSTSDMITEFAYEAMENLSFDRLEAGLNSQADGRLGVLFHIRGRHDPPKRQQLRLGIFELVQRDFMNKALPLPSGTEVNLTLDTTLNLDDLLADYAEYLRLRSSGPVQP